MALKIFRHQWTGAYTKRDKLLYVIPAGLTEISFPVTPEDADQAAMASFLVDLPPGCMTPPKLSKKWDKYPIGLPEECPTMEITWQLGQIPEDTTFNEFHDCVLKPKLEVDQAFGGVEFTIQAGTYYKYYQKVNDSWVLVFDGIHNEGVKGFLDLEAGEEEIIVKQLSWMVLHETSFTRLYYAFGNYGGGNPNLPNDLKRGAIIELLYTRDLKIFAYGQSAKYSSHPIWDGNTFPLLYWSDLLAYMASFSLDTAKILTRNPAQTYWLNYPLTKYYKQLYDESGGLGSYLSVGALAVNLKMFDYKNRPDTAINVPSKYSRYSEFFADWFKESLTMGKLTAGGIETALAFDNTYNKTLSKDLLFEIYHRTKSKSDRPQVGIGSDPLGYVDSSLYEQVADDIDVVQAGDESSDSDSLNLPIVFSNHPVNTELTKYYENPFNESSMREAFFLNSPYRVMVNIDASVPRTTGLFYMDKPTQIQAACEDPGMPFRVHEYCDTPISLTVDTSDLDGCGMTAFDYPSYNAADEEGDYMGDLGRDYCKPTQQARAALAMFKDVNTLKIKLPADAYDAGGGCLWTRAEDTQFALDLSDYKARLTGQPTAWHITSVEYDDEKEIYSLELISGLRAV